MVKEERYAVLVPEEADPGREIYCVWGGTLWNDTCEGGGKWEELNSDVALVIPEGTLEMGGASEMFPVGQGAWVFVPLASTRI